MQNSSQSNSAIQPFSAFLREICSGERDNVSIPKKGQVLAYKSWLHRRRSAHFYTVVHINNNHQDTLTSITLKKVRLTPKACLRRVSQSVASHQVLTSLRYILLLSSFFFFFWGGGEQMISPPHKHDV